MIVAAQFVVTGQAEQALLWRVAGLGEDEHAVVAEAEVSPVVIAALLLRIAVVDADHPIGFERERVAGAGAPGCPRIGGDAIRHIEKRRGRLTADGVADELAVQRRGEEVVGGGEAPVGQVQLIVEERVVHLCISTSRYVWPPP
jgi:hypothetical protein